MLKVISLHKLYHCRGTMDCGFLRIVHTSFGELSTCLRRVALCSDTSGQPVECRVSHGVDDNTYSRIQLEMIEASCERYNFSVGVNVILTAPKR